MAAGATYFPIATTTLGSSSASVTLSSIPSTYTDLLLVCNLTANTAPLNMGIRFNSDTSSLYSGTALGGNGSTAASTRYSGTLLVRSMPLLALLQAIKSLL
jgi:hypothetical protein